MASKEERILELFFNEPAKQWHFSDIVKTAKISEPSANKWLKKLEKEKAIQWFKPSGKMPYFISNFRNAHYMNAKKIFALQKMHETGLLAKLQGLKAEAVVIFGSFSRSDWNRQSDVDVFVLGEPGDMRYGMFWKGLGFQNRAREVEVHSFRSKEEINKIQSGLMKNVIKGYFVKGNIHNIAEVKA